MGVVYLETGRFTIREWKPEDAAANIEAIYGMADPQNQASSGVMGKIGMAGLGSQDFQGEQDMLYRVDRSSLNVSS